MTESSSGRKLVRRLVLIALILIAVAAPGVVLTLLNYSNAVTLGALASVAALIPTLLVDWRAGALAIGILGIATALITLVTPSAMLCALIVAGVAALIGLSSRNGMNTYFIMVLVGIGFIVAQPPTIVTGTLANAGLALFFIVISGAWTVAVSWVVGRAIPRKPLKEVSAQRAGMFAIVLALLTGLATVIVVHWDLGHPGGWMILTISIVLQPYMQDAWTKTLHRAGGTILGFGIAFVIGLMVHTPVMLYVAGFVTLFFALGFYVNPKRPYWLYVTFLTPTVVLLEGASSSVTDTAESRLIATLGGALIAVCAEAVLTPLYRRSARRLELDHY